MSLNWSIQNVKNWDSVCYVIATENIPMSPIKKGDKMLNPVTNHLIWHTMIIGMGSITEKNYVEFYNRLRMYDISTNNPREYYTELSDIEAHIGLSTNASSKTYAQFKKDCIRWLEEYSKA